MRTIKLLSADGDAFPVSAAVAKMSLTIGAILEDLGIDDDEEEIIPLPNVASATLKKIIEWADHHKDDSVPLQDDRLQKSTSATSSLDEELLNVDRGTLFDIIRAANYLDIKVLGNVACRRVANMMRGKTPDEIRALFNIASDPIPTEEQEESPHP